MLARFWHFMRASAQTVQPLGLTLNHNHDLWPSELKMTHLLRWPWVMFTPIFVFCGFHFPSYEPKWNKQARTILWPKVDDTSDSFWRLFPALILGTRNRRQLSGARNHNTLCQQMILTACQLSFCLRFYHIRF